MVKHEKRDGSGEFQPSNSKEFNLESISLESSLYQKNSPCDKQ